MERVRMEHFWIDFLAGWAGGISGVVIGHPMDTVKVRQQILGQSSAWQCFVKIIKYEGVHGVFKGMASPLVTSGILNSLYFGVYGNTLKFLTRNEQVDAPPSYLNVYLAGCSAGVAQLSVACPVDLVKIKLQVQTAIKNGSKKIKDGIPEQKSKFRGPLDCLSYIYKIEGLRGCYRGLPVMFWRDVPTFGVYVLIYEKVVREGPSWGLPGGSVLFCLAGGAAGVVTWASIIPLDVIKTRIQADNPAKPVYRNTWHCVVSSYKSEGYSVFTRGFSMVVLRAFPVNAATFVAYQVSLDTGRLALKGNS